LFPVETFKLEGLLEFSGKRWGMSLLGNIPPIMLTGSCLPGPCNLEGGKIGSHLTDCRNSSRVIQATCSFGIILAEGRGVLGRPAKAAIQGRHLQGAIPKWALRRAPSGFQTLSVSQNARGLGFLAGWGLPVGWSICLKTDFRDSLQETRLPKQVLPRIFSFGYNGTLVIRFFQISS